MGRTKGPRKVSRYTAEFALNRAVSRRRLTSGLIFHSDRGVEFSAYAFRARLAALGITQSMWR
jgi:putative transposase